MCFFVFFVYIEMYKLLIEILSDIIHNMIETYWSLI